MNEPLLLTLLCLCIMAGGYLAGNHLPMIVLILLTGSSIGTCLYAYIGIMNARFAHGIPNMTIFVELAAIPTLCFIASMWAAVIRKN